MKAVIQTGGKQYLVAKGEQLIIERIEEKKTVDFEPLMLVDGNKSTVGTPVVTGAKVSAKIVDDTLRAPKVTAIRYKAKKRVHKRRGHRQDQTLIEITDIVAGK